MPDKEEWVEFLAMVRMGLIAMNRGISLIVRWIEKKHPETMKFKLG